MDCLIKHRNKIANPRYGMLEKLFPFLSMAFAGCVVAQFGLTVISVYIDVDKNMRGLLKWLPKLILTTIEEILLQFVINVGRLFGMITFYWRRLVW